LIDNGSTPPRDYGDSEDKKLFSGIMKQTFSKPEDSISTGEDYDKGNHSTIEQPHRDLMV